MVATEKIISDLRIHDSRAQAITGSPSHSLQPVTSSRARVLVPDGRAMVHFTIVDELSFSVFTLIQVCFQLLQARNTVLVFLYLVFSPTSDHTIRPGTSRFPRAVLGFRSHSQVPDLWRAPICHCDFLTPETAHGDALERP